ncbi:hypothetical protein R1flu_022636 [Riccia fluitans]|uniref:Uncharacterized protein n=1 Tax=Riccia fluitans TaxID=41844 RepID=A0ABD1XPR2_9MARC
MTRKATSQEGFNAAAVPGLSEGLRVNTAMGAGLAYSDDPWWTSSSPVSSVDSFLLALLSLEWITWSKVQLKCFFPLSLGLEPVFQIKPPHGFGFKDFCCVRAGTLGVDVGM